VTPPVALTIAGSDSGGGAGIQADLRVFASLGLLGTTAITAVTAQDTVGVHDLHLVPAGVVRTQVEVVLADLAPAAVKTGMLGSSDTVKVVAELAVDGRLPHLVVDPVVVSTTGAQLLEEEAVAVVRDELLPRAAVVTPNRAEAAVLAGGAVDDLDDAIAAARELHGRGTAVAVVTGGHPDGDEVADVVVSAAGVRVLRAATVATDHDHGTGCTFSAAIAALLAHDRDVHDAIDEAAAIVRRGLELGARWRLGAGRGPVAGGWVAHG
jgi:hydroxymethylpyrimidine/phosphomethylpyrimidine kinase